MTSTSQSRRDFLASVFIVRHNFERTHSENLLKDPYGSYWAWDKGKWVKRLKSVK